jgi:hypothetical protein
MRVVLAADLAAEIAAMPAADEWVAHLVGDPP